MAKQREYTIPPLRILHIFSRLNCGGAERRTLEVARYIHSHPELRQRIHCDYCVLSGLPGVLDEEAHALGATIHYLPLRRVDFVHRFKALLREGTYNVVHSHVHHTSGFLVEIARLAKIPGRICHFRSQSDGQEGLSRAPFRWVMKRLIDHAATGILTVSRCVMEALWGKNWIQDDRRQVVYNGVDVSPPCGEQDLETRARLIQAHGLPQNARIAVHVGAYRTPKNHGRLIEIFHHIHRREPRSHLMLVGDLSTGTEHLSRQVAAHGLTEVVHFLGLRNDVPRLLRAADVMVFPSLWEGLPGAVLESLAVGTPVVASDIPPHREIASHLPGIFCVPLEAPDEYWASKIISLPAPTPEDRDAAWLRFTNSPFTLNRCVDSLLATWEESLSSAMVKAKKKVPIASHTCSQRRAA